MPTQGTVLSQGLLTTTASNVFAGCGISVPYM